jgi:hypothetical protein
MNFASGLPRLKQTAPAVHLDFTGHLLSAAVKNTWGKMALYASSIRDEESRISNLKGESSSEYLEAIDAAAEHHVVRKCNWRVVPPTLVLFRLSFLDR